MKAVETSEIYEEAAELRELLNKIPDWKNRMSAQFLACIRIGNRELKFGRGDRGSLGEALGGDISSPTVADRKRVFELMGVLYERGRYEFSSTPERYALRAFIMSVILGQEYANADAITLINGLREGTGTK